MKISLIASISGFLIVVFVTLLNLFGAKPPGLSLVAPLPDLSTNEVAPNELQEKKPAKVYLIRVVDESKNPVVKAKVTVELANNTKAKWQGDTDSEGIFKFTWEPTNRPVQAHISVEAPGFWSVDDYNALAEDRLFQLKRSD